MNKRHLPGRFPWSAPGISYRATVLASKEAKFKTEDRPTCSRFAGSGFFASGSTGANHSKSTTL